MVDLAPVRAWHPDPDLASPNDLVCPVYDTLSDAELARYSRHMFNAAGFVPRPRTLPLARFLGQARSRLSEALAAGAFRQDPRSALYVYGIRYSPPPDIIETIAPKDRRHEYLLLGLVGALDLDRVGPGEVALHERTFEDRVDERVALTDATGMSFAPIVAGYHLPDHRLNDLLEQILGLDRRRLAFDGTERPVAEAVLDGTVHRLWRVDDPAHLRAIREIARPLRLLILDGHHRFTAAAHRHFEGRRSAPLTMIVDGRDRALRVLPWHRVLPARIVPAPELIAAARREFERVRPVSGTASTARAIATLRAMGGDGPRGFLAVSGRRMVRITGPARRDVGADFDLLHAFLEERLHVDPHELAFLRSPRAALAAAARAGPGPGTALLLPGLTEAGIEERAFGSGAPMAHKSTMFLPKVVEGLIFARADGRD